MEQPLITLLCKEQAAEAALNGSSARKAPQGEAAKRGLSIKRFFDEKMPDCCSAAPHQSLSATASPQGEAAKRGLSIKRLFDEKMPDCCSAAPHHLASQGASPRGEALTQGKGKAWKDEEI